jgi:Beta-Casp domain
MQEQHRPALLVTDCSGRSDPPADQGDAFCRTVAAALRRKTGHVLVPVDSTARVLELLLLLERHWAAHGLSFPIVFLARTALSTLMKARAQLEFLSESIQKVRPAGSRQTCAFRRASLSAFWCGNWCMHAPPCGYWCMHAPTCGFWCTHSSQCGYMRTQRGYRRTHTLQCGSHRPTRAAAMQKFARGRGGNPFELPHVHTSSHVEALSTLPNNANLVVLAPLVSLDAGPARQLFLHCGWASNPGNTLILPLGGGPPGSLAAQLAEYAATTIQSQCPFVAEVTVARRVPLTQQELEERVAQEDAVKAALVRGASHACCACACVRR